MGAPAQAKGVMEAGNRAGALCHLLLLVLEEAPLQMCPTSLGTEPDGAIPNTEQGGDRCLGFAGHGFGASLLHLQGQEGHIDNDEEVRPPGLSPRPPRGAFKASPIEAVGLRRSKQTP